MARDPETGQFETQAQAWLRQQYDATRRQIEENQRSDGRRPDGTARAAAGGWLGAVEQQLDGQYDAAAAQSARDRARAQGDPDPVTGGRVSPWLRTMAGRMTPTENPAPRAPVQPNPVLEAHRARMLAEREAADRLDRRARDGWLGVVERSVQAEFDRVAAEVEERDRVAAERAADRRFEEREAARAERRAAAEERRRQLVDEIAAEVEAELAAEGRRERRQARQRLVDDARVASAQADERVVEGGRSTRDGGQAPRGWLRAVAGADDGDDDDFDAADEGYDDDTDGWDWGGDDAA